MASVINTNIASLLAQKNLSGSQSALSTSVERLSSGLRINRAKDDAAGLGISEKIKAQVTALNQGARNANDAISLVQTAEGSLSEVSTILQRMKELSVQARNDSLSTTQRSFISDELVALKNEINSIAERTTFNDLSLLKNALRTDVVASASTNKMANGRAVVEGLNVANLAVNGANEGTYSFSTATEQQIDDQRSRANTKLTAAAGTDTTQKATATTSVITLSGVYEAGDTISVTASGTAVTYTVTAEDLTLNGDGTGGAVAGNSSVAITNIATSLASYFQAQSTNGTYALTAFNQVTATSDTLTATETAAANRTAGARTVAISSADVAEGNKLTLTVDGKDYSVVVGSDSSTAALVTAQFVSLLDSDYPATVSAGSGSTVTFAVGSGLTGADISFRVNRLDDSDAVESQASYVSPVNTSTAAAARTITINDFDVIEGRRFTVTLGNPEQTTTYSTIVDADDTAAKVAARLEDLINDNLGSTNSGSAGSSVTSNVITISTATSLGQSVVTLSVNETVEGESVAAASTVNSKNRAESARTITLNQNDLEAGNVVSVVIGEKEYAVEVSSGDTANDVAYRLAGLIDDDYPNTSSATATVQFPLATRVSVSSNVITLTSHAKVGLEDIGVTVKQVSDAGILKVTAQDDTGLSGVSQSIDIGTIRAGGSKTFNFDNLGITFDLVNSNSQDVDAQTLSVKSSRIDTLEVGSVGDGNALFQVGAGTRDTVDINGFKDIRITGYNKNSGNEALVFDNVFSTLSSIAENTTASLSEANFATLENQLDAAITTVSDFRAYLGAQQNRIEFAISNIQAQSENLTAANSRIVDTDYAAETANLTKTQIMQQAATAMLAQANQMPNVILALLK